VKLKDELASYKEIKETKAELVIRRKAELAIPVKNPTIQEFKTRNGS